MSVDNDQDEQGPEDPLGPSIATGYPFLVSECRVSKQHLVQSRIPEDQIMRQITLDMAVATARKMIETRPDLIARIDEDMSVLFKLMFFPISVEQFKTIAKDAYMAGKEGRPFQLKF